MSINTAQKLVTITDYENDDSNLIEEKSLEPIKTSDK